jgi:hypothetical protein
VISAVVFVPTGPDFDRWFGICAEYCERHRYQIAAVATDWDDVLTVLRSDEAQIAVVARRDHLPASRKHRLEVVTEASTTPAERTQRRSRRTRAAR